MVYARKTVRENEGVCKPPLMTTTSHVAVVGSFTVVSEMTDLLQNDHWTDGGHPICGNKSVPNHGVLHNSGFTTRFYCVSLFSVLRHVFYFWLVYLHFLFNLAL